MYGGTTAAPHIAAVYNRAGWTMGKVKDTYIQYAAAGDQHVGRVVSGLLYSMKNMHAHHLIFVLSPWITTMHPMRRHKMSVN